MTNYRESLPDDLREIVGYFLVDVPEDVGDRIGEQSVVDLDYGELVKGVELDLLEAYLENQLSPEDRALYENNYLVTDERRAKLGLIKAMLRVRHQRENQQKGESDD